MTRIIGGGLSPLDILPKSSLERVPVPLAAGWGEDAYRRLIEGEEPEHRKYWARWWLGKIAKGEAQPSAVDITLALMEIAPGLRFAGVSGELLTGMGLKIKRRFRSGTTLPLGYTNGVAAYVPDTDVLAEGGTRRSSPSSSTRSCPPPGVGTSTIRSSTRSTGWSVNFKIV